MDPDLRFELRQHLRRGTPARVLLDDNGLWLEIKPTTPGMHNPVRLALSEALEIPILNLIQ